VERKAGKFRISGSDVSWLTVRLYLAVLRKNSILIALDVTSPNGSVARMAGDLLHNWLRVL
jgi:hypothetical protein